MKHRREVHKRLSYDELMNHINDIKRSLPKEQWKTIELSVETECEFLFSIGEYSENQILQFTWESKDD